MFGLSDGMSVFSLSGTHRGDAEDAETTPHPIRPTRRQESKEREFPSLPVGKMGEMIAFLCALRASAVKRYLLSFPQILLDLQPQKFAQPLSGDRSDLRVFVEGQPEQLLPSRPGIQNYRFAHLLALVLDQSHQDF